jgi:hypothetical protein
MRWLKELLPKEHGTWAMLLVPWVVGVGVARRLDGAQLVLLGALLLAFLGQHQLGLWIRARRAGPTAAGAARRAAVRAAVILAAAIAAGVPLLARVGAALGLLIALAGAVSVAALVLVARRVERALPGQILGAVGLPASAAAAHAVGEGQLTPTAWQLWALCALFFLGGVFYVRLKIDAIPRRRMLTSLAARLALARGTVAVETAIVALAAVVVTQGALSTSALLAFAPVAIQAVVGVVRLHHPARLKRVGIISTIHALVFAFLVIALA